MRIFTCEGCGQLVFFENSKCLRCQAPLGYLHARREVISLAPVGEGALVDPTHPYAAWQRCASHASTACNWLVPAGPDRLCESCALTRTRPADGDSEGLAEWLSAEMAKRRLLFQLAELGLPVRGRDELTETGLAFDLLSSTATKVITGHDNGVITLDLAEADSEHREHLRLQLDEPYRTVLGHFRHEIGHYYWPILVNDPSLLKACRSLFGDETVDYSVAMKEHYTRSHDPDESWKSEHISRYATMHPYEDWAETFAHYLHILDSLQTAESFGLGVTADTFEGTVSRWLELSYALNQLNRSMGREDLYPFVLAPAVIRKLAFIDELAGNG
jgi:hypothetical protein